MMWFPAFILMLGFCGDPAAPAVASPPAAAHPFHLAELAPADVSLMVHVERAAAMRLELADRPIAHWFDAISESSQAAKLWDDLATHVGVDADHLFDLCFGSRVTLMVRSDDSQWTLITEIPQDRAAHLLGKLNAIVRGPRYGAAMFDLPEHDLLIARTPHKTVQDLSTLIIGPKAHPQLFEHVLSRMEKPAGQSLATEQAMQRAAQLGPGHIGVYMKHEPPMGGWSVTVGNLVGEELALRYHAQFDNAPFNRGTTQTRVNASMLANFEDHALFAVIEPTDIGGGPLEAFVQASFGRSMLTTPMQRNLCKHRIIVVGEIEGRQEPKPVDIQATTLAVCMELKDAALGQGQFDRQMVSLAKRLDQLGGELFHVRVPCETTFKPGEPRTIDISPATQWLTGSLPLAQPVTLNWTVISKTSQDGEGDGDQEEEEEGGWAVLATHPQHLKDSIRALRRPHAKGGGREAHSCGYASGSRIGQHLRSWSDRADLFAGPEHAAQLDEFRKSLLMMSKLTAGVDRARWHLNRPSANELCLEVTLQLAAPESARE